MESRKSPLKLGEYIKYALQKDEKIKSFFRVKLRIQGSYGHKFLGMGFITDQKLIFRITEAAVLPPAPWFIILHKNEIKSMKIKKNWVILEWDHLSSTEKTEFKILEEKKDKLNPIIQKLFALIDQDFLF